MEATVKEGQHDEVVSESEALSRAPGAGAFLHTGATPSQERAPYPSTGAVDWPNEDGLDLSRPSALEPTDPSPLGHFSSRVRSTKTVATVRAEEWMQTRFTAVTPAMFGTENLVIYTTEVTQAPPAFESVWFVVSDHHRRGRFSSEESTLLNSAEVVLIFSDTQVEARMQDVFDVAQNIADLGAQAPPVILLPHSMCPELRSQSPTRQGPEGPQVDEMESELQALLRAVDGGVDDVLVGEPSGIKMVCEVRSRMKYQVRNAQVLNKKLNECRELLRHVSDLEDIIHDSVWDYLRVRIRSSLPSIDEDIGPGIPQSVSDFIVGQQLGEGSFGTVCRLLNASNSHGSGEVLKLMDKNPLTNLHGIVSLKRQLSVMRLLSSERHRHENVMQFYQVYHTETHILFRMEDGGPFDLYKRLVLREEGTLPLEVTKIVAILKQCMDCLSHMHSGPQVVHRDLKPENLIISETPNNITVKFADFDTAQVAHPDTLCQGIIGTFPFMAPEVVMERRYRPFPADIWSLAAVFLEVVCRLSVLRKALNLPKIPNGINSIEKARRQRATMENIQRFFAGAFNGRMLLQRHLRPEYSELLDDLSATFQGMLNVVVEERWGASAVRNAGQSRFLLLQREQ